jgi:hypothetical protein
LGLWPADTFGAAALVVDAEGVFVFVELPAARPFSHEAMAAVPW